MGCTLYWVKLGNSFAYFVVTCLDAAIIPHKFYFDCKTKLCLIDPGMHEKIYFCTRKFLCTNFTQRYQ